MALRGERMASMSPVRPKYASNSLLLIKNRPVPLLTRTRAMLSLRRPIPSMYCPDILPNSPLLHRLRFLHLVWMLRFAVYFQITQQFTSPFIMREHTPDSRFDHFFRIFIQQ